MLRRAGVARLQRASMGRSLWAAVEPLDVEKYFSLQSADYVRPRGFPERAMASPQLQEGAAGAEPFDCDHCGEPVNHLGQLWVCSSCGEYRSPQCQKGEPVALRMLFD